MPIHQKEAAANFINKVASISSFLHLSPSKDGAGRDKLFIGFFFMIWKLWIARQNKKSIPKAGFFSTSRWLILIKTNVRKTQTGFKVENISPTPKSHQLPHRAAAEILSYTVGEIPNADS